LRVLTGSNRRAILVALVLCLAGLQIGCEIAVDIGKPYIGRMTLDVPKVDLSMEAAYEEYLACPGQYRGYEVQGYGEIVCPVSTSVFVLRLATLRARFMMLELVGEARSAPPLLVGDNVWFGGCLDGTSLDMDWHVPHVADDYGGEVMPRVQIYYIRTLSGNQL
jgi:hypothetical protein